MTSIIFHENCSNRAAPNNTTHRPAAEVQLQKAFALLGQDFQLFQFLNGLGDHRDGTSKFLTGEEFSRPKSWNLNLDLSWPQVSQLNFHSHSLKNMEHPHHLGTGHCHLLPGRDSDGLRWHGGLWRAYHLWEKRIGCYDWMNLQTELTI